MATGALTGSEAILQSEALGACEGYVDLGFPRPVRILVRSASPAADASAARLFEALDASFSGLGVKQPSGPACGGSLRSACLATKEAHTLNLLVWVSDGNAADATEGTYVSTWLRGGAGAEAVAVVPEHSSAYVAVPAALAGSQVIWWNDDAQRAALDVVAAVSPDSGERRVFLSYSHRDGSSIAHAVRKVLTAERFSVFFDSVGLSPGADYGDRIQQALSEAAFLVLIETPGALRSAYVREQELGVARAWRLGIATVRPSWSRKPPLAGIGGRRWDLPKTALLRRAGAHSRLRPRAATELGGFLVARHTEAIQNRRWILEAGLLGSLAERGVSRGQVSGFPGGLRVTTGSGARYVSMRPRPAGLTDMHEAFRRTPAGERGVMVSATPAGLPERDALAWLGEESVIPHRDEGRLDMLAEDLVNGTV